ncbi:MAG: hypothetical protein ACLSVD_13485 [Eggerthellaceae bacterium]
MAHTVPHRRTARFYVRCLRRSAKRLVTVCEESRSAVAIGRSNLLVADEGIPA